MPRTTPWLFYEFFVQPNYDEFADRPDDIRLGFNASVAAFQQADIFWPYYKRHDRSKIAAWPSKKQLLISLGNSDPYFLTIQSVANAYKHLYLTDHYEIGSPMALWGLAYPRSRLELQREWGEGKHEEVVVKRKGKSDLPLKNALHSVVCTLWPAVLPKDWGD